MAYPQTSFSHTSFSSPTFISRRRDVVYSTTLLYQLNVLKSTGRYDAFKLEWHLCYHDKPDVWPVPNHLFWDSDVAKWIEGACYFLLREENPTIDGAVKELVAMIRSAQQADGYLNIHFTVVEPTKRFTNLRDLHELYNAGHLIEAALAHTQCYGNDLLMEPVLKYVDLLCATFGPGPEQKHGYPGHPEIELALLRLYGERKNPKHLTLAEYFIAERGNPTGQDGRHYYDVEAEARGDRDHERPVYYPKRRSYWYQQAHEPIVSQQTIEGHSVRAMYLLTAVADLVRIEGPSSLKSADRTNALQRLWRNMTEKKMYLTGGIGAQKQWEGFGIDYFLPSSTDEGGCYAETCAAIGVMMLAERLLQLDLDGKYADIMELCFYNAVMTGMASNGKQFTYINQLASTDSDLSRRAEWFTCACCPPNVTRLLGYIGGYLWSFHVDENEKSKSVAVDIHMYSSATLSIPINDSVVEIEQSSNWPWEGKIAFTIRNPTDVATTIKLRIPAWAATWQLSPPLPNAHPNKGYISLPPAYLNAHPTFHLEIPLLARFVSPHAYTNQTIVALARGPIVYCVEDFDNPWVDDHFKSLVLDPSSRVTERAVKASSSMPEEGEGESYIGLTAHNAAFRMPENANDEQLAPHHIPLEFASDSDPTPQIQQRPGIEQLHFIPYALRDNRGGKGHMRVGIRRKL
ncbi:Non-reducing end beta-L-arabinofuranosidase [Lachnellula subtilissima]|uniref:Non-reducing end beta-L-arabinofuranosidase n=1 Tax=Lachnellula subtilissima TaxID=602034 RepID=A0A8H8RXZ2_9HELO|nr:Non-reducing end beta-L-arabinofuranosidase [Lachnellula subtilissima]